MHGKQLPGEAEAPQPEAGGARTAASGQGAAEGLPVLASPPRPPLPQSGGEGREEEGDGSTLLPSLPAGGRGHFPARPQGCRRPRLPSKRGSGLSSGNSMAGTGARMAAALPPFITCRAAGSHPLRPAGPARPAVGGSGGRASVYGCSLSAER